MDKRMPLFYSGVPIGVVYLVKQGSRFVFIAECRLIEDGVLRAYACSGNNPAVRLLIGVMMPEKDMLTARRVYTRDQLRQIGVLPEQIDMGEIDEQKCEQAQFKGWVKYRFPQRLFSDYALKSSLCRMDSILADDKENPTRIAARIGDGEFCLAPAFCLIHVETIDGKLYGVLGRTNEGMPIEIF